MLRGPAQPWHRWHTCVDHGVTVPAKKSPEHGQKRVEHYPVCSVPGVLSCLAASEQALDSLCLVQGQLGAVQEEPPAPSTPLLSHIFCQWKHDRAIAAGIETPWVKRCSPSPEPTELLAGSRLSRTLLHRAAPGLLTDPIGSRRWRQLSHARAGSAGAQLLAPPYFL